MKRRTLAAAIALSAVVLTVLTPGRSSAQQSESPQTAAPSSAASPQPAEPRGSLSYLERQTIELFERAAPSVVYVAGRKGDGDVLTSDDKTASIQSGTGFIWGTDGYVVTNDHVVDGTKDISVRLVTGEVMRAEIVGLAPTYDLAVLRLQNPRQLPPPLTVGTSANLKVGQFTYAIGNPFGLDHSLTTGVISALKRRISASRGREISNVIQTDAAINPGNSGGPLLDSSGRLIGVNTQIYSTSGSSAGIGFAIPVDTVSRIVPELIRNGRVPMPGIGVVPAPETVATQMGVQGIIVMRVFPNSPAGQAGVRGVDTDARTLGDVIVNVSGKPAKRIPDLTDELERIGVGGKIQLTLKRNDSEHTVELDVIDAIRPAPAK